MRGQLQGRGTLALLGVIAVAVVVALAAGLGFDPRDVLAPSDASRPAAPATGQPAPTQPAPGEPQTKTAEAPRTDPAAPPPGANPEPPAPSFDVVRVEPNGESVIAGRSVAGATIEMLRDGQVHARTAADQSGLFAFVPPVLQPGSHQVTLQSIAPDGTRQRSRDSVTIVVNEGGTTRPLVALTSPDKPTVLLSNPETPEPRAESKAAEAKPAEAGAAPKGADTKAAEPPRAETKTADATPGQGAAPPQQPAGLPNQEPQRQAAAPQPSPPPPGQPPAPRPEVKITTVEAEEGGRLYVSGQAAPGSTVRLYLNDTFIAPGGVGADGKVAFAIGRGVRPGDYRVRIDDVDPVSGSVKSRAEVGFNVPVPVASTSPPPAGAPTPSGPQVAAVPSEPPAAPPPTVRAGPNRPQAVAPQPQAQTPAQSGPSSSQGQRPATVAPEAAARAPAVGEGPATPPSAAPAAPPSTAGTPASGAETASGAARPNGSQVASATAPELRDLPPGTVVIPDINTAIVSRGDNLWRISQRIYGHGLRYTVIYGANQSQIRNPHRIYPGQVFVLPDPEDVKTR
jgi:nucleoid-associated protein YgaU